MHWTESDVIISSAKCYIFKFPLNQERRDCRVLILVRSRENGFLKKESFYTHTHPSLCSIFDGVCTSALGLSQPPTKSSLSKEPVIIFICFHFRKCSLLLLNNNISKRSSKASDSFSNFFHHKYYQYPCHSHIASDICEPAQIHAKS